jgi:hypothetical protein
LDYGVEQDFYDFLNTSFAGIAHTVREADFVYIPFFWTRYHLQNNFGGDGLDFLQSEANKILALGKPTFTVCQYDDGPLISLPGSRVYLSSRKSLIGLDAPLLASPLPAPSIWQLGRRKYLANFVGREDTHTIRRDLVQRIRAIDGIYTNTKGVGSKKFASILRRSMITLAPRGYGGSSFRFYEAIRSGSVPWLIGDVDTRPFKELIDWDMGSFYSKNVHDFETHFQGLDHAALLEKKSFLQHELMPLFAFGRWNKLLIADLESAT